MCQAQRGPQAVALGVQRLVRFVELFGRGKRPNEAALLTPEALSHLISKVNVFWILLVSLVFPSGSAVFMDIFLESWSL